MEITCCRYCKPPKRTPTCHATCPEYIEQKAQHDAALEQIRKANRTRHNITNQKGEAVRKAIKYKKIK